MEKPLSFKLRPNKLNEYFGQKHLTGENKIIYNCIKNKKLFSMIFFGPSGVGKTSLAKVIANELNLAYREFNAAVDNKKRLDEMFIEAEMNNGLVLIVDEIHRLNKDKQDLLLPHIESGLITLIGATTANPYFSINPAIRSRVHLFELFPLNDNDIKEALLFALNKINPKLTIDDDAITRIINCVNGDLRYAYNILEIASLSVAGQIKVSDVENYTKMVNNHSYKDDDAHYDLVSAFQKSIRGSDVDAALYYMARLLLAGDFESIERRLLVTAYEDIGLANPEIVARTLNAVDTAKRLGFPENVIPLGLQIIDLCLSAKSKSACKAAQSALALAKQYAFNVPKYLRLTPIGLAEDEKYDYDNPSIWHQIQYLPNEIKNQQFYQPSNNSYEKNLQAIYQKLANKKRSNDLKILNKK